MLPKRKRITKKLFMEILKKGKIHKSPLFLFRYLPQNTPQYAFVVPKTVYKSAVDRNNLRRTGYNSINKNTLPNVSGIFFFNKEVKNTDKKIIKEQILNTLEKIK